MALNYVEPTIQTTGTLNLSQGVKAMVYGRAGVGKTTLAVTCPGPFIISAESGLLSIRQWNLPYTQIGNLRDLENVVNWAVGSANARNFATMVLDSASEIAETVLTAEKIAAGKDPRKAYGQMAERVVAALKAFRDLTQHHVLMIAKQERGKDEVTGGMMYRPGFPGQQLNEAVPYLYDLLMCLQTYTDPANPGVTHRILRTQPDNQYDAKDRSGKLAVYEPADFSALLAKIYA